MNSSLVAITLSAEYVASLVSDKNLSNYFEAVFCSIFD